MTGSFSRDLATALVEDLAIVLGGLIDSPAQVLPATPSAIPGYQAEVTVSGTAVGSCTLAMDGAGASAVTALIMGLDGDVPAEAIVDTLREVCSQALTAASVKTVTRGATLKIRAVTPSPDIDAGRGAAVFAITAARLAEPLTIVVSAGMELASEGEASTRPAALAAGPVAPPGRTAALSPSAERVEVILDIDLPLTVRFGRTELPLKALARLGPGSLIDLGRSPDDPVEILVSNRVVARGEVVIVSGNYGIRIVDVVSARDRATSLEE